MKTRLLLLGVAVLMGTVSLFGQNTTTLTGTVTDSDGFTWDGATVTANLFNPGGGQPMSCNQPGVRIPNQVTFTLTAAGAVPAATTLQQNSCIVPAGTSWTFTIQSLTSAAPVTITTVKLTTSSFNFGTYASTGIAPFPPRFTLKNSFGYGTVESQNPVLGSIIYLVNITPNQCDAYTTTGWTSCGAGSGTGNVNAGLLGHFASYPANGTTVGDSGTYVPTSGSGAPSTGCDLLHVGQVYYESIFPTSTSQALWICTAITGPSYVWVPQTTNEVTATNTTSAGNFFFALLSGSSTGVYAPFVSALPFFTPTSGYLTTPGLDVNGGAGADNLQNGGVDVINGAANQLGFYTDAAHQGGRGLGTHLSNDGTNINVTLPWSCQPGYGDGLNAIPAGTYLQSTCLNTTGSTITLNSIRCFSDNNGTSTMNVTDSSSNALLTGAVTCSTSFATGTQSSHVTLASGSYLEFTFVADGTTKQSTFVVAGNY